MKPLLLDLFCGAGGAAMGYSRAGYEVVGIDINPQPHFPFTFVQGDALDPALWLEALLAREPDVIHASPPCQAHSTLRHRTGVEYVDLIPETRELLILSRVKAYVIENVVGAPLIDPIRLCGSSFGLGVRRHRLFESNVPLVGRPCDHASQPEPIDVSGNGHFQIKPREKKTGGRGRKPKSLEQAQLVMDMPWSNRRGISQAIPPAYTEWIGTQLLKGDR